MDTLPTIAHIPQAIAAALQNLYVVGNMESSLPVARFFCVTEPVLPYGAAIGAPDTQRSWAISLLSWLAEGYP